MITFIDGPARGQILTLRRAPLYLRVVRSLGGTWDALDQLIDQPRPKEEIFIYERIGEAGRCHLRIAKRGASGFYAVATYMAVEPAPTGLDFGDTEVWQNWAVMRQATTRLTRK